MSFQSTSEGLRCRRADGVSSGPGPSSKAREDQRSSLQRVGRREGSLLLSRAFCQASSGLDEAHALSASTMSVFVSSASSLRDARGIVCNRLAGRPRPGEADTYD